MPNASEGEESKSTPQSGSPGPVIHRGTAPIRVILADDHPVVRAGLRHLLELDGIEVVGEAGDGRTLLRLVDALEPDVVVIDISMPELNGIDAARAIRRQRPGTRVLMLSVHCNEQAVMDAVVAGATGFVLKEVAIDDLCRAVEAVALNQGYFSPEVASLLARRLKERGKRRAALSAREREIVQLIAEGNRVNEIATRLFISPQTVKTHRANAMRKLGLRSTAELIRWAITQGLAEP